MFWVCLGPCCFQVGGAHLEGCLKVQLIVAYDRTGRMDSQATKIALLGREFCGFFGHKGLLIHCRASSPGTSHHLMLGDRLEPHTQEMKTNSQYHTCAQLWFTD